MATKLLLLAALFAASVAIAAATTYTTVVTTTVNDEEASWDSCEQEFQQMDPNRCQQYFMEGQQWPVLKSTVGQQQEQMVQDCCETIRQVRPECRCHAIRYTFQKVMQRQQQQEQGHGRGREQHYVQKAEMLPQLCRFQSPSQCSFRPLLLA